MQGAVRPHMLQIAVLRGTQVAQTGPSALRLLTRRRRRQWMHCSKLTGSVTKHLAHNGFPLSSRAAGSRTVPQREQDTALALAVQLRQIRSPSRVLLKVTTRPQRGQAGRWMWDAPKSQSASISLSTIGNGRFRAASGEELGGLFDSPRQLLLVSGLGDGCHDCRDDRVGGQSWIQRGDHLDQNSARVAGVAVRALRTARSAVSVAEADLPLLPTGCALLWADGSRGSSTSARRDAAWT